MVKSKIRPRQMARPFYDEPGYLVRNPYALRVQADYPERIIAPSVAVTRHGAWNTPDDPRPLDVEIGTGKGRFITEYSLQNPQRRVLGIELRFRRLHKVAKRLTETGADNAWLLRFDGACLRQVFAPGEIERFFIFFPDPWMNKDYQSFRRLIDAEFLLMVHELLAPGGEFHYKTDQRFYWENTLELLASSPLTLVASTDNLAESPYAAGNIEDYFEEKFRKRGLPAHYVMARKER